MEPRFRRTSSRRCCRRRCRAWASRAAWGRATTWKRARVRAHGEGCCCHLGLRAPRWAPHRRLPTGRTSHTNLEARRHRRPRRRPRRRRSHLRRHQRRLQQTCARRGSRCSSTASACPRGTATRGGTQQPQSLTGRPTSAWRCGAGGRLAARPWRRRRRSCPRCSGQTRSSTHTLSAPPQGRPRRESHSRAGRAARAPPHRPYSRLMRGTCPLAAPAPAPQTHARRAARPPTLV
mmetsp:Transcript_16796/g.50325  ORF Transcript_16796/g.50325 Transcript_16796/m.50325 type:complete len:234 (+) Transcript_16796:533-1234(+)